MPIVADAAVAVRGDLSRFDNDLKGAEAKTKSLGDKLKGAMTGAAIGAGVGGLASIGIAAATSVDNAFDAIRVGTGATGQALKDLQSDFKAVAGSVPDDIGLVGQVLADLNTRTGQTGEGLQNLTEQILDMSRITGTDATGNVALATRAFGDWSVATEDQADTLDMFFRASQQTGIGVDKLMESVVQFGAPLRNIGFTLEESAAMMGKWEKEGVNTTLALGGLKIALGEFAKEGVDAKDGLAGLIDQITNADTAAEAMALGVAKFGSRAGPDMVAAIREGRFEFDDYTESIANGTETIADATSETEDFSDKLKGFFNNATVAIGEFAAPLAGLATAIPGLTMILPKLGGGIGALAGAFGSTGKAGMALSKIAPLIGASFHAMLGPIGLVTGAIALLAAAFATDFLGIRTETEEAVNHLAMNFGDMGDTVHALAGEIGVDFDQMKNLIKDDMAETGRTFDESVRHFKRTRTDWGAEHDAMLAKSESTWEEMQGITSAGMTGTANAISSAAPEVDAALDVAVTDPVLQTMLEAEENANKSGYQVVIEYAKGLLTPQTDVQVAIEAALQVAEDEMSRTEEFAYLSGQRTILEEARGLASAEGKVAAVTAIDAALDAVKARMDELPGQSYNSGYGVVTTYAQGMWAGIWQISDAANAIASTISNVARIESEPPSRNSPLYGITKWGGNMVKTIADGMLGELGTGSAAANALAASLVPGFGMPGMAMAGPNFGSGSGTAAGGGVNNYTVNVAGKEPVVSTAQDILNEMARLERFK